MKNIAINILRYKEMKDNKEWFDEGCRQLLKQMNKSYQAHLARLVRTKRVEYEEIRKRVHTACRKKNRQVIYQQLITNRRGI
jgi:hypothetical protein